MTLINLYTTSGRNHPDSKIALGMRADENIEMLPHEGEGKWYARVPTTAGGGSHDAEETRHIVGDDEDDE